MSERHVPDRWRAADAQLPPHSIEAERSVLGATLIHADAFPAARRLVSPGSFYRDSHRHIFAAEVHLADCCAPINIITVKNELERTGHLDAAGGPAYLADLVEGVPLSGNVDYYASMVAERERDRKAISAAEALSRALLDRNGAGPGEGREGIEAAFAELAPLLEAAGTGAAQPLETFDLSAEPPPTPSPLVGNDEAQLIMPGEATAIASDPGIGKTKTLTEIALGVASGTTALGFPCQQQPVVYVSSDGDPDLFRNVSRQWAARGPKAGRLADLPLLIASDDAFVLDDAACRARLGKTLEKAGADKRPALCIVESLATNVLKAEDLTDQVLCRLLINRTVRALMKSFPGLTVIMSCHLRKVASGGKSANDLPSRVAGSMQIRGAFDSVLGLVGTGRDAFTVRRIKRSRSGGDFEAFKVQISGNRTEPLTLTNQGPADVSLVEARGAARGVLEFMRKATGPVHLKLIVSNVKEARPRAIQDAAKRLSEADHPRLRRVGLKPASYEYIKGNEADDLEEFE